MHFLGVLVLFTAVVGLMVTIALVSQQKEESQNNINEANLLDNVSSELPSKKNDLDAYQAFDNWICHQAAYVHKRSKPEDCLGPPYIYLTFHGGDDRTDVQTICKYTRDGCSLGSAIIRNDLHHPHSFRGMILQGDQLIVADAWKKKSRLLLYSDCDQKEGGRRHIVKELANTKDNKKRLIHPYGFAEPLEPTGKLYVSVQGTNSVLAYQIESDTANGVTDLVYDRQVIGLGDDEIRGIAFDKDNRLNVANKKKGVQVYSITGSHLNNLDADIPVPIALYYSAKTDTMFATSSNTNAIYQWKSNSTSIKMGATHAHLQHPAGLAVHEDSLFVISQKRRQILELSAKTGELLSTVLPSLPDAGEALILSAC